MLWPSALYDHMTIQGSATVVFMENWENFQDFFFKVPSFLIFLWRLGDHKWTSFLFAWLGSVCTTNTCRCAKGDNYYNTVQGKSLSTSQDGKSLVWNTLQMYRFCFCDIMTELQMRGGFDDNSKIIFFISLQKHMLWSIIRTVSARWF